MDKEKQFVMICPKCKSVDISIDNTDSVMPALGLPTQYVCNKCGYSAYAFPEISVSKIKEK